MDFLAPNLKTLFLKWNGLAEAQLYAEDLLAADGNGNLGGVALLNFRASHSDALFLPSSPFFFFFDGSGRID
jgi:hypothetical protein